MKKVISGALVIFTVLFMLSCSTSSEENNNENQKEESSQAELILYGSNSCDHCLDFKAQLDKAGIKYIFNDVEQNQQLADEMVKAVQAVNYRGYIEFPVIVIGKKVFVNPPFADVMKVLQQ